MTGMYTKGPWTWLVQHGTGIKKGLYSPSGVVLRPEEYGNNVWLIVTEANAHLITAAPELLEALTNMVGLFGKREGDDDELLPSNEQDYEVAQALNAIAKARGEA